MNTQAIKILDEMIVNYRELYKKEPLPAYRRKFEVLLEAKEEISSLPSLDSQWIDVNEKYPEDNEYVLGFDGGLVHIINGYATESGGWIWMNTINKYTHWMKLPDNPK